ncbi:MAG: Uma2 family endonuclease, partial [Chloroflexota bacterium]
VALSKQRMWTFDDFMEFVFRPENEGRIFEFINGEIIEKMPGRTRNAGIPMIIAGNVYAFCREHKLPFYTSGADGTYRILGHVIAPDFAYKHTPLSDDYPDPVPPLWVVEVISPTEKPDDIRAKRLIYIAAKILYWELYPKSQSIDIYAPGQPMRTVEIDETLNVGDLIPGLTIPAKAIFAED